VVGDAATTGRTTIGAFHLVCPICHDELAGDETRARCLACQETYPVFDGIWRFLPETRRQHFARFLTEYRTVREAEGWGRPDPAYYRSLPSVDRADPQYRIWTRRARSYHAFVERVLRPREATQNRPLTVLDLGAGNCWLAHRLALRGHDVMAVDISTDPLDGLGAWTWYRADRPNPVRPVQAEFDHLPLGVSQADLVIFDGSLHYAESLQTTLNEALRVLRPDGQIVVLDSPYYPDDGSGDAMVREREARFFESYGFAGNALAAEGYLSPTRLDRIAVDADLRWSFEQTGGGWQELLGRWRARLAGRRMPASFPLLIGWPQQAFPPRAAHGRLVRAVARFSLRLCRRLFQPHADQPVLEVVDGTPLLVLPGVFNPKLLRTGALLVQVLETRALAPGARVLDLGTGSGIGAVFAGRRARQVVGVDVNPDAVRCARINLLLHHLEDRCEVREGDLFGPVGTERFDLILFNPPFYRGEPRDAPDRAWRGTDIAERFAAQLGDHLTPDGEALVILSSDGDASAFLDAFQANPLVVREIASRDLVNETLVVYRIQKARR
jgi:methylase of polypeptide subunit release factors/uncharacterized protein YbaR (Trm112 family)